MARFLHVADIHLGFDRYNSQTRSKDFFYAFHDVLQRYAVEAQVDFVVIVGDLFEHRTIQPSTLNQAQICLQLLQQANIPVIAIEGNHDNRPYGTKTSWLRYLAEWNLLIFLEPGDRGEGEPFLQPWKFERKRGSYIDLDCGVRVIGSYWYGAMAPQAIEQMAEAIQGLPPGPSQTMVLFHHGLEGHVSRYAGALRYEEILPLRTAGVDYLALGHIHKSYSVENWVFNPGSIEVNSMEESRYERGAYLVEMVDGQVVAQLCQDYRQRSLLRLQLKLTGKELVPDVEAAASDCVQMAIAHHDLIPADEPIVELRISGTVGFEPLDLNTKALQQHLKTLSGALIFLLRYDVDSLAYQSPLSESGDRYLIEEEIYQDIVASHARYQEHTPLLAKGLMALKDSYWQQQAELQLYELVGQLLQQTQESPQEDSRSS
ncbi:MAG: metallophosphoesterase [Leptolyngbyaceae bacterium]|nr:metallophosphoesterase [Leptolyngbyaceae bacterium]